MVRDYVMTALNEAVEINQVHNRDPIGGSNENLFLYVIATNTRTPGIILAYLACSSSRIRRRR